MTIVTQADREAAADIVGPKSNEGEYPGFACDYREGRCDTSSLVQAFARHREAAFEAGAKAMQDKSAMMIEVAALHTNPDSSPHEIWTHGFETGREVFAATVRALDPAQIAGGQP